MIAGERVELKRRAAICSKPTRMDAVGPLRLTRPGLLRGGYHWRPYHSDSDALLSGAGLPAGAGRRLVRTARMVPLVLGLADLQRRDNDNDSNSDLHIARVLGAVGKNLRSGARSRRRPIAF